MTAATASAHAKAALGRIDEILDLSKNKLSQDPRPPLDFGTRGDQVQAGITGKNPAPAEVVALESSIRPEQRGIIPLVLGRLAAVLYLIFYRDVLKPKETEWPCRCSNPAATSKPKSTISSIRSPRGPWFSGRG